MQIVEISKPLGAQQHRLTTWNRIHCRTCGSHNRHIGSMAVVRKRVCVVVGRIVTVFVMKVANAIQPYSVALTATFLGPVNSRQIVYIYATLCSQNE